MQAGARADDKEIVEDGDADESSESLQVAEITHEDGNDVEAEADLTSVLLSWLGKGEPGRVALASSELPVEVQEEMPSAGFSSERPQSLSASKCACGARARYRCPGCGAVSCSLACVRAHKSREKCSGVRDKAAFVPLTAMSDSTLRSDLAFLDGLQRDKLARQAADGQASGRDAKRARHAGKQHASHAALTPQARTLVSQARRRGVRLLLLPQGMSRRRANTSHYDPTRRELAWLVEWRTPCADATPDASLTAATSTTTTPTPTPTATPSPPHALRLTSVARESECLANLWQAAKPASSSIQFPSFYLLREPAPAAPETREKRLEASHTLAVALSGETLLENPIILVREGTKRPGE